MSTIKSDTLDLDAFQIDALNEIGSISMGNATTALSRLVNRKVQLNLTNAHVLDSESILKSIPESVIIVSVTSKLKGDMQGMILLFLELNNALTLGDLLLDGSDHKNNPDMIESAITEAGNILIGSYLDALSRLLDIEVQHLPPQTTYGGAKDVFDAASIEIESSIDNILTVETMFMIHSAGYSRKLNTLYGDMFMLLDPDSLKKLIDSINEILN